MRHFLLVLAHVAIISISNILVQYPLTFFGLHSTWGSFTYPLIFIFTDLSTRLLGAPVARKIVFSAMIPALLISLLVTNFFSHQDLWSVNTVVLRIAFASFCAYLAGQLLDIFCFQSLRRKQQWWLPPVVATLLGNIVDTYLFFAVAFWHSRDSFMGMHWLQIANIDLLCKIVISGFSVIPLYGLILSLLLRKRQHESILLEN